MFDLKLKEGAFLRMKDGEGKLLGEVVAPEPIYIPAGPNVEAQGCGIEGCNCTVLAIWLKEFCMLVDAKDVEIVPSQEMTSGFAPNDDDEAAA